MSSFRRRKMPQFVHGHGPRTQDGVLWTASSRKVEKKKGRRVPKRGAGGLRVVRVRLTVLLGHGLLDGDGDGDGGADHGVVAHAQEAHHLHVRGHGGGAGELGV